jgi:poly-beta-1,6-N-acetyl-D-glucosamine synthase
MTGRLSEFVVLFPAVLALSWIALGFVFVVRREWRLPFDADFCPSVAVVVPAHNEEMVIAAAVEALLAQDYPALRIHVVSDGSTDRTVEIARGFATRGVVVHELTTNVGKSGALQHVLNRIDTELFLVVDADTRTRPDAIRKLVQQFAGRRVGGVTGHARVGNVTSPLTAMQCMEYAVIVGLAKRAEQFWGGLYTVSGAAACFRTEALRAVGGWTVATATEDIEISWRLQRAGWLLAYDPRALFFIQAPVRLRALYRQRRRWAQGMVEVLRLHWSAVASPNRALIPITAQVVGAAVWMVLATGLLVDAAFGLASGSFDPGAFGAILGADWYVLFLWTFGLFGVQTAAATLFDGAYLRRGWRVFPLFVFFPIYFWVVIYPSFVVGAAQGLVSSGATKWARTERAPVLEDAGFTTSS